MLLKAMPSVKLLSTAGRPSATAFHTPASAEILARLKPRLKLLNLDGNRSLLRAHFDGAIREL